jgi:hypothetical protein
MALLAHGERTMNTKRIAALVTLGALLSTAGPAMAAAPTGTVQVEWNYSITATLTMYTQTTASQTHTTPASTDIYGASDPAGSATAKCNNALVSAGSDSYDGNGGNGANAAGTVNFGDVVADSTDYTDCLEVNAIDAYIVTNDSAGAILTVNITANNPTNYGAANGSYLCDYQANTWSTTGNTAWAASSRVAAVANNSMTSCASGGIGIPLSASGSATLLTLTKPTTGSDINQDLELVLAPQTASGAMTPTFTYTFTTQ